MLLDVRDYSFQLNNEIYNLNFSKLMVQVVVYNPTSRVIYIGENSVSATSYLLVIHPQKLVVSPFLPMVNPAILQTVFTSALINPTVSFHRIAKYSPSITSIT